MIHPARKKTAMRESVISAATEAVLRFDTMLSRVYARQLAAAAISAQQSRLAEAVSPAELRQIATRLDDDDQTELQRGVRELADLLDGDAQ